MYLFNFRNKTAPNNENTHYDYKGDRANRYDICTCCPARISRDDRLDCTSTVEGPCVRFHSGFLRLPAGTCTCWFPYISHRSDKESHIWLKICINSNNTFNGVNTRSLDSQYSQCAPKYPFGHSQVSFWTHLPPLRHFSAQIPVTEQISVI